VHGSSRPRPGHRRSLQWRSGTVARRVWSRTDATAASTARRDYDSAVVAFYDLSGRLSLSVAGSDGGGGAVRRHMDPFVPAVHADRHADVAVAPASFPGLPGLGDIQNPAGDGLVTAADGARLLLMIGGRACVVPDPARDGSIEVAHEPGFPVGRLFRTLLRPTLQVALPRRGAVAVHGAAVEVGGRAVVLAGWSESGKTEAALALMENGARFLSDKWTVLGVDGEASAFPVGVGVRRWVLPYLPRLAGAMHRRARAQVRAAGIAAALSAPLRRTSRGPLAEAVARATSLADRVALTPGEVRAAYAQQDDPARRVPLGVVVLLTTIRASDVTAHEADPAWAAARLARTAAYERRGFFQLLERRAYAFAGQDARPGPAERTLRVEQELLASVLDGTRTVEVRAPFPVDPRRIATTLGAWLPS
jgi:hypothetical protein